jgi:hypothetical protein
MRVVRPRKLKFVSWFACLLLILQFSCLDRTWAQAPATQAVGSMQATREVYLNGSPATGEQTVYPGDTVRTGADGAAALTSTGFGLLIIPAQTEITFRTAPFLATLKQGSVEVRSMQGGKDLEIQFGNTVMYLPTPEIEASGVITLRADGSAQVSCVFGSLGLKSSDGVVLGVLHPLQSVGVSADGKLQQVEVVPLVPTAQSAPIPVMTGHAAPKLVIGLAVAAAGTAAAVLLLTRNSNHPPVSSP